MSLTKSPHEFLSPREALLDDGARILHLGRLAPTDLWLFAQPRLFASGTVLGPQRLRRVGYCRHVL